MRSDDEIRDDIAELSEPHATLSKAECYDRLLNDVEPLLARVVGAEAERDAALAKAGEQAIAAIRAVPRRFGTREWSEGAGVAQGFGFDMGLATAVDAVRTALGLPADTTDPNR